MRHRMKLKQDLQISKLPHLAISAFLCLSFSTRSAFPRAMISSLFLASSCTNNQDYEFREPTSIIMIIIIIIINHPGLSTSILCFSVVMAFTLFESSALARSHKFSASHYVGHK